MCKKFQSTPSQRGRLIILPTVNVPLIISIHALAKRATSLLKCTTQAFVISIHALAKRATGLTGDFARRRYISIHALAKRATYKRAGAEPCYRHFNPRPRKEGDGFRPHQIQNQNHFNPRPRKEGDYFVYENNKSMSNISIHALAKRATSAGTHTVYPRSNFNPRPRKEGDAL